MDILTSYIFKSFIAGGILYCYYLLALKNKKFHSYNRFYLLLSVVVSLVIPFLDFNWLYVEEPQNIRLAAFVNSINPESPNHPANLFTTAQWLTRAAALISVLFLILFILKIRWIYSIKRKNVNTKMHGFTLIETEAKQAPFSFLNNLFWKHGLPVTDANGQKIFKHELAHIIQGHTYDKLFTQIVCCICWINPFYWFIQRELNTIHEFIADAASVNAGDTESFAKMLLHSYSDGSYLSPYHPFFNSSIKRRLIMISSSNKTQYSWLRRILALPVILLLLAVLSVSFKAQTEKTTNFKTVKSSRPTALDTIPDADTALFRRNPQPIITTGQKPDKDQNKIEVITVTGRRSDTTPGLEPVTVTGKKSDTKPGLEPITITGQKSDNDQNNIGIVTVTGHKSDTKPGLEPVTVTGKKSDNEQNNIGVVTVTGHKSDTKPGLEPVTVTGKKSDNEQNNIGVVTVTGYKSDTKPGLEPVTVTGKKSDNDQNKIGVVTVTGYKSDSKPGLEPITVTEQPSTKKQDQKPITITGEKPDDKPSQKNK